MSPKYRRKGIGRSLIQKAVGECRTRKVEWVHVDYEEQLEEFYKKCGFKNSKAGLIHINKPRKRIQLITI